MTAVYLCECGHPKVRHQGGTYWCLDPDCACKRYTPNFQAPATYGESTSARLRRVEQERDEARACWSAAERHLTIVRAELASARTELDRLRSSYSGWIVARDGGRDCATCDQEIRRGEAYSTDTVADELRHVHCPDGAP